jgi:transposase, IS5 family
VVKPLKTRNLGCKETKKQAIDDERVRNFIEGKFGQGKRRFSLGRVMAKLPHTSLTSIAITFLVMNLSTLLSRLFWGFLCPFFQIMSFLPDSINKIDILSNFR